MADRSASEGLAPWPSPARYLGVVALLVAAGATLHAGGAWVWAAPALVLGVLPLAELLLPERHDPPVPTLRAWGLAYQGVPYALAVHQIWMWASLITLTMDPARPPPELAGMILTVGMAMGGIGLNVAHDLGHRASRPHQRAALALLCMMLYGHWRIEHTRGHHSRVGTPEDPASARRGESLYAFALRSGLGGLRSAWRSEVERLSRQQRGPWTLENEVLDVLLIQGALVVAVGLLAGPRALMAWLLASAVAMLLTESVNYTQHYGLSRPRDADGRWAPVSPALSWCSDRVFSRVIFLELPRHGDHHSHPMRPYAALEHRPESPTSPAGLLGQIVLSLIPWAWFRVMHPRLDQLGVANSSTSPYSIVK